MSLVATSTGWAVAELSVVPEGDQFLVGDPTTGTFVLLPEIGLAVIDGLRAGAEPAQLEAMAAAQVGESVDIASFLASLHDLGFVRPPGIAVSSAATSTPAGGPAPALSREGRPPGAVDRVARAAYGRVAWTGYATAAAASAALLAARPRLFPRVGDLFFLSTPARSLAALTALTYLLAAAHEGAHWLAARSVGVRGSVTVSRRLYALTLETDLTGLWALPRRRRYGPLLAGMAFDATVLAVVLLLRLADESGLTTFPSWCSGLLAALTFVQIAAIGTQFWVFVRTDVYALLVTATGCVNLYRTTQLSLLQAAGLARPEHRAELAAAPARDRQTARWYRWLWLGGMVVAAWFFAAYFLPAVVRTATWVGSSVTRAGWSTSRFWEALILGVVLLSPTLLTIGVMLRDGRKVLRRRATGTALSAGPITDPAFDSAHPPIAPH